MSSADSQPVSINVDNTRCVSGLFQVPVGARACYVLAHGAGAGMQHPFMAAIAIGLADRAIATLRFQFPYMEQGAKRPDTPKTAQMSVRAAVGAASQLAPGLPLFSGGKSFGGRMSSQAQAESPMPGVRGLIFLGFPLHPAGKPSNERATHLFEAQVPMLFIQGTRDALADFSLLRGVIDKLGTCATLKAVQDADHSFHVPARSGRTDSQIRAEVLDALAEWMDKVVVAGGTHREKPAPKGAATAV